MKRFFSNSMNIILTVSLAAIIFIIVYLGINVLGLGKQDIIVPDFSTMNVEQAKQWFADNNLADKQYVIDYEYDDEVKEGKLIYPSIKADEKLTSAIRLVYSKGVDPKKADLIEVPDFNNLSEDEIKKWANDNNINLSIEYIFSDTVEKGKVIEANVEKGSTINKDKIIMIVLSKGKESSDQEVVVKDSYIGYSEANFVRSIEELGLKVSKQSQTYESTKYSTGSVYAYDSTSDGITFKKGDTVRYWLVKNNDTSSETVTVPDSYIGYTEANFIKAIEALGLKASKQSQTYTSSKYQTGTVYAYDSTSDGITFKKGDTVKYYLVNNGESIETEINVPDSYIGYTEANFIKAIEALGLKASKQSQTYTSSTYQTGAVYAYDSTSDGITFKKGDTVRYWLVKNNDTSSETVTVPDSYIGYTEANFIKAIEALGLKASKQSQTYTSSKYQTGTVYAYNSTSDGITFKKGDIVKYWLVKNNDTPQIETVTISSLIGKSKAEAQSYCNNNGLTANFVDAYSDNIAEGRVISTNPSAGTTIEKGKSITITISLGSNIQKAYILKADFLSNNYSGSTFEETKNALSGYFAEQGFINVSYVGIKSDKTIGRITAVSVDGNASYNAGEYPINTPIVVSIVSERLN